MELVVMRDSKSRVARRGSSTLPSGTENMNKKIQTIKKILNQSIDFEVNGGKKLSGTIKTNFSKNGSVGLLCASLLNSGVTTLHGIARIEEVYRVIEKLKSIGVKEKWLNQNPHSVTPPKKFNLENINAESAIKTRSIMML